MYIGGDFLCISDLYNEEDNIVIYNCVKRIFSDLEIRRSLKLMQYRFFSIDFLDFVFVVGRERRRVRVYKVKICKKNFFKKLK